MIRVLLPQIHHLLLSTPEIQPLLLGLLLQRYQMFLRGPIHLTSFECLQSHLQTYSLNTVIHPRPTLFQLLSLESWWSILLLHFWLSPTSHNDTSPAYQGGISRTSAGAMGEKRFTWMLPSSTWTSHPVPRLDYSSYDQDPPSYSSFYDRSVSLCLCGLLILLSLVWFGF